MKLSAIKTKINSALVAEKSENSLVRKAKSNGGKKMRVGIVGAGLMGKWHARAAVNAGGKIVCITDPNENRANKLVGKYRNAEVFRDAKTMLSQQLPDVLHICTPTASHQRIAETAIRSGVNIFIEKPLAMTADETNLLYKLAAENDVKICPAHQFAFQRCVRNSKTMISRIGKIVHLEVTICSAGSDGFENLFADSTALDILPHPLSLFQTFLNQNLSEKNWKVFRPQSGELRINGYEKDVSLAVFISMNARPTVNYFQIIGTEGTIYLDLFHDFAVLDQGKVSKMRKILHPFDLAFRNFSAATYNLLGRTVRLETAYPGLRKLVSNFYQSVREDSIPPITFEEAINVAVIRDFIISQSENKIIQ